MRHIIRCTACDGGLSMHKTIIFLKRRADLERAVFFDCWRNAHRPLVEKIPGLRRYTISLEAAGEDGRFDGLAELWFDDAQASAAGLASPAGRMATADTRPLAVLKVAV